MDLNTGQRLWPADKRIDSGIPDTNRLYPEITSAAQFIYAVWADEQANDIYGQKLDRDGAKLWGDSVRINATSQWATLDYAARGPALVADIEGNLSTLRGRGLVTTSTIFFCRATLHQERDVG